MISKRKPTQPSAMPTYVVTGNPPPSSWSSLASFSFLSLIGVLADVRLFVLLDSDLVAVFSGRTFDDEPDDVLLLLSVSLSVLVAEADSSEMGVGVSSSSRSGALLSDELVGTDELEDGDGDGDGVEIDAVEISLDGDGTAGDLTGTVRTPVASWPLIKDVTVTTSNALRSARGSIGALHHDGQITHCSSAG